MPESIVAGDNANMIRAVGVGAVTVGKLDMVDELLRLYGERILSCEKYQFDDA